MPGPLPQKNKNTKRADDWRKQIKKRQTQRAPTWQEWWAMETRRVNLPEYPVFRPDARLDPSSVSDRRGPQPIVDTIARWFLSTDPVARVNYLIRGTGPKVKFPVNTPLGKLQQSYHDYQMTRNMPQPGPAPKPRVSNPGLLGKYRR